MAFSRGLGVIGLVTVSWLAAVGCSDDDNKKNVNDDAGGEAGETVGGKSSAGSNNGGKGGSTAGTGGTGGATAGSSGDAGAGGGEPPIVGGGAGAGGEAPVTGGAGAGGEGGEPALALLECASECEIDDDCLIDGAEIQKLCDSETKRCYDPSNVQCATNDDCVPSASFWFTNCTSDNDCADDDTERCISFGGQGWCATVAVNDPEAPPCIFGDPTDLPIFGVPTATANVCAATLDRCNKGICQFNCADPIYAGEFCGQGDGDTCNEASGLCECDSGTECGATGVCGADDHCAECVTDQDCIDKDAPGLDKCYAGKCGCGGALSCPDIPVGATPVCE